MNFLNSVLEDNTVLEESVSIDNFYIKSLQSFSSTVKNLHKNFINSQKDIFSNLTKLSSAGKSAIRILNQKHKYYSDDLFGWINKNSDKFMQLMLVHNKNVFYQAKIIEEYIKKQPALGIALLTIPKDIYFETKARITKQSTLFLGDLIEEENNTIPDLWYMDKDKLISRMEYEKVVYIEEGNKNAKVIIELFKKYQEDVKVYWKEYKNSIKELREGIEKHKKACETYIERKIPTLKNKSDEAKENLIKHYKMNIDTDVKLMQMISEHYKYQLKMIIQSLKQFSLVIQDIYDYVIKNKR